MMNIEKETLDVLIGVAFEQLRHGYPLAERDPRPSIACRRLTCFGKAWNQRT